MATSKQEANEAIFTAACERVEAALKERETTDEVTYFSVEGLPPEMIARIQSLYLERGWRVDYEECPGEYEDLRFS